MHIPCLYVIYIYRYSSWAHIYNSVSNHMNKGFAAIIKIIEMALENVHDIVVEI